MKLVTNHDVQHMMSNDLPLMRCKRPYLDHDDNSCLSAHKHDGYQENEMDRNHRSDDLAMMRLNFYEKRRRKKKLEMGCFQMADDD